MTKLMVRLLGGFTVTRDGDPVTDFDSNKVRALLAYLAAEADRAHRRESLAALLWPGYPESSARTNLRNALSNLRTAIGDREADPPFLWITRDTLQFNGGSDHWLDVRVMSEALATADERSTQELFAAADLYTGDVLAGFTLEDAVEFDDWATTTRERLRRQALDLLGLVVARLSAEGDAGEALTYARRRVELEPWHEGAQRQLIRLLAATGRRSAALRQYRDCVRVLKEELGAAPSPETLALGEKIQSEEWAAEPGGMLPSSTTGDASAPSSHSLPSTTMQLVGREALLDQIAGYLRDETHRLITLVGPGGSGKTRLAIEVGRGQLPNYRHGVFFVQLAALRSPGGVWPAIAKGVGFVPASAQSDQRSTPLSAQLSAYLRQKHVLLILDNAEHLLSVSGDDGLRATVTALLSAAPSVTVLVTSRERLRMLHEQVVTVTGIGFESASPNASEPDLTPAAQLFVQSARRAVPSFSAAGDSRTDVDAVCRAVQGMPLAILLAASWVDVLSPREIAAQLVESEGEGLGFLTADWADVPERHRSLMAVFDGSWGLLTSEEQAGFAALSIFRGGFTRSTAQAVAHTSLRVLRSLVTKSLVQIDSDRYGLHPLLRAYAAGKLKDSHRMAVVAARHGQYYADWVTQCGERLKGPGRATAMADMDAEIEDAIQAWEWAADRGEAEPLLSMVEGLREYLDWRDLDRYALPGIRRAIDRLVPATRSVSGLADSVRLLLANLHGWLSWFEDTADGQHELVQRGLRMLAPDQVEMPSWRRCQAWLSLQNGHVASRQGDHDLALAHAQAACDGYRAVNDTWWQAYVLQQMGNFAFRKGDSDAAASFIMEALGLFRTSGDGLGEGWCLLSLGNAHMRSGNFSQARQAFAQGMVRSQAVGDDRLALAARTYVGLLELWQGEYAAAEIDLTVTRSLYANLGLDFMVALTTAPLAYARLQQGDYADAARMAEDGLAEAERLGWDGGVARCCRAWGQALLARGDMLRATEVLEKVPALDAGMAADERADVRALLAIAGIRQGETETVCGLVREGLAMFERTGASGVAEYPLSAAALLLSETGAADVGLTVYTATREGLPKVANGRWFEAVIGAPLSAVARKALTPEAYEAAEARGRNLTVEAALHLALPELDAVCGGCGGRDAEGSSLAV